MKGVIFEKVGADPKVVSDLEKPQPGANQILVKSIYTAMNPVDTFMSSTGLLVYAWPMVLGCDAAGVVVEVGSDAASRFQVGDEVCGCTRLGFPGYSTVQEYFLMDAPVTIPKPEQITLAQAATVGVGIETASLGIFYGLDIDFPKATEPPQPNQGWIIVLGGASSVGKYAIQLAKAAGYNVAASCSSKSFDILKILGAHPFDYKLQQDDQIKDIVRITGSGANRIFDAVASNAEFARAAWKEMPVKGERLYTTTNDWDRIEFDGVKVHQIELGYIGRPEASEVNERIAKIIPVISGLWTKGFLSPAEYTIQGEGFEGAIDALKFQQNGKGGSTKVLVKLQDL